MRLSQVVIVGGIEMSIQAAAFLHIRQHPGIGKLELLSWITAMRGQEVPTTNNTEQFLCGMEEHGYLLTESRYGQLYAFDKGSDDGQ